MQTKLSLLLVVLTAVGSLSAQNVYDIKTNYYGTKPEVQRVEQPAPTNQQEPAIQSKPSQSSQKETKSNGFFTGFTGGMMVHVGYAFAQSPDALFRNGSLKNLSDLPKDGLTVGLGGTLRIHLINHIHLGAEGGMSVMPLMYKGSSVRNGWGGAICDFYGTVGKVQLFVGGLVGGGTSKRLFVPGDFAVKEGGITYNASYTSTPYFLLDPYVGLEIGIAKRMSLIFKLDYMLPFGKSDSGINTETVRWSNFMSPSGPRLYVGILFGKYN